MAFIQLNYHSDALGMGVSVNVILPEQAKTLIGMATGSTQTYKTLYLLHGLSDDHSIWMRRTSIERYAAERGIAVVMPAVGRSWYTDTAYGAGYFTFITQELPAVCRGYFRGMSQKREDTLVAGLSMGGYGAVKAALRCPETFGGCASLSGALDIIRRATDTNVAREPEWRGIFGDKTAQDVLGGNCDLFALAEQNAAQGPRPRLFIWCGTEDFLLEDNRRFHEHLQQLKIAHRYKESKGNHSWQWWDKHIQTALDYLLKE